MKCYLTDTPIGQLVDQYRQEHPEIVAQLEAMIAELSKLTVLLHEECHAALGDIQVNSFFAIRTSSYRPDAQLTWWCSCSRHVTLKKTCIKLQ